MYLKEGQDYNSPKHINGESPSGSEYQLESSEEGTLKPMLPETVLQPIPDDYKIIYLLAIGNNNIPIVGIDNHKYELLYENEELVQNIYNDAVKELNRNHLHIMTPNGLRSLATDMVKEINVGRANAKGKFIHFKTTAPLKRYHKILQQSGSQGKNYFYVVFEYRISGGSKGAFAKSTFKKHSKKRLTKTIKNKK
jgi:hypothetical protein